LNPENNIIFKRIIFIVVVVDYQNGFESQITNITKILILNDLLKVKI